MYEVKVVTSGMILRGPSGLVGYNNEIIQWYINRVFPVKNDVTGNLIIERLARMLETIDGNGGN